jgi:hypothetical protein
VVRSEKSLCLRIWKIEVDEIKPEQVDLSESRRCVALHRKLRRKRQRAQNKFKHTVPQPPAFPRFYSAFNDITYQDQRKASLQQVSVAISSLQGFVSHTTLQTFPQEASRRRYSAQSSGTCRVARLHGKRHTYAGYIPAGLLLHRKYCRPNPPELLG